MNTTPLRAVETAELTRLPPQNLLAEQELLGAILSNNDAADRVTSFLKPEHFSEAIHARIYEAALSLIQHGRLASAVTLKTHFEMDQSLKEIGGTAYLARLAASATTIINAEQYGRMIFELARRRQLITLGTDVVNEAFAPALETSVNDLIEKTESALYALAENEKFGKGFQHFKVSITRAIDMASAAHQRDGHLSGISCGLTDLDEKMGGLQRSDLIILAGRPAMGKTALATNIAYHVARNHKMEKQPDGSVKTVDGGVVAFFSLEMSSEQLATRIIAEQASVASEEIRRGKITNEQFDRLVDIARDLERLPLYIDDTGGLTIAQVASRARRLKRQRGSLGLIVVDYLQLLSGSSKRGSDNRVQEVTEITVGLKALAKELDVPIIALSQLSRQVEARDDKRPQLADLRESGSIEQDADVVLFVYREEYYLQRLEPAPNTTEHQNWMEKCEKALGKAEVIIGKQRHGPTGTVELQFEGRLTKFSNLAREDHLPQRRG